MRFKCKKVRQNLYRIPIAWRSTHSGHFGRGCLNERALCVDNVGFFYYAAKGEPNHHDFYYRYFLMCRQFGHIIIEAESFHEALTKFYKEWYGATVGGDDEESKAVWITRTGGYGDPILQLPKCSMTCWECDDNWDGIRLVCGGVKCHQDCIYDQGGDCCGSHPECGMSNDDFDCDDCPATKDIYPSPIMKKTYSNPNPPYPLVEIDVVNGLIFQCVVSPVGEYL